MLVDDVAGGTVVRRLSCGGLKRVQFVSIGNKSLFEQLDRPSCAAEAALVAVPSVCEREPSRQLCALPSSARTRQLTTIVVHHPHTIVTPPNFLYV